MLFDYEKFNAINKDDITSIVIKKYTESGLEEEINSSTEDIENIYDMLKNVKIKSKTNRVCEDNTTFIY